MISKLLSYSIAILTFFSTVLSAQETEPEKVISYRLPGGHYYYFVIAVWGGNHVVRDLLNGNIRAGFESGKSISGFAAWAWCQGRIPEVGPETVRFGLEESQTLFPSRNTTNPNKTKHEIRQCLKNSGWVDDRHVFCDSPGNEACAFWRISEGCFVNREWYEWAEKKAGRKLNWPNKDDMMFVCGQ